MTAAPRIAHETVGRVEMIVPSLIAAGMEMITWRLGRGLRRRGWEVGITCLIEDGEMAEAARADGLRVRTVRQDGIRGNVRPARLAAWLASVRPTVVHVHSGAWIKGAHAARRAEVARVVFTEHGLLPTEPRYSNLFKRWGAHYCDRVIAVSEPLRDHLRRAGIPERKLAVIMNGVDVGCFAPTPPDETLRRQLGLGQDLVIGHVARCSPEKNQHLLLDAFRDVLQRVPGVHLVLVGDGPLREALRSHAAALGVSGRVHFVGVRHDMPEVYRGFDVFVLPSLAEGTSMSILEAMASGRAIVASAVGGSPHLLDGGACGVLVPATSRASLVQALEELCRAPERRRALGLAARQRAVTHFSEDQMTEAYVRVYLGRPADPPPMGHDPCAA